MDAQVIDIVDAEGEQDPGDWMDRLLVAQKIEPSLFRHQVVHYLECPVTQGQPCQCQLLSLFSNDRRIVLVDGGLQTAEATLH